MKITKDEWFAAWMLGRVRKRKKIDSHELQSLRNVVKRERDTIIKDFENKFTDIVIEGERKKGTGKTLYTGTDSTSRQSTRMVIKDKKTLKGDLKDMETFKGCIIIQQYLY